MEHRVGQTGGTTRILSAVRVTRRSKGIPRPRARQGDFALRRDPLLPTAAKLFPFCRRRPHFFQQRKKWGKERRQKPMVFGFPFAAGQCVPFRPNCESTYSSERCRFCSEMRRCVRLHFTSSTAAGIIAEPFHILGGFGSTGTRNVQGAKCSGRKPSSMRRKMTTKRIIREKDHPA